MVEGLAKDQTPILSLIPSVRGSQQLLWWRDEKEQGVEKSALLALLQILYLFFCHTVGCPRDLGLIKEKI